MLRAEEPMHMISRVFHGFRAFLGGCWNGLSLVIVLAVAATIPILQFASLGYMLESSGRIARGMPASRCFPGAAIAGTIVSCAIWIGLTWLPVWLVTDLAYSAELIEPGSLRAQRMRLGAQILAGLWVIWSAWALFRGGRWWHFLWPAPIRFAKTIFHLQTWREAEDRLWNSIASLHLFRLMKLGLFGTIAAIAWLAIPGLLMIVSLTSPNNQAPDNGPLGLIGLIGALGMLWVLMYLPFLPIHMASEGRLLAAFDRKGIRAAFRRAPFAFLMAVLALVVLSIPLYPLRIEVIPAELWWILSFFFVTLIFPAKLLAGWALRRSKMRQKDRHWSLRWIAWIPLVIALSFYIGFLYLAKFAVWEGTASILLQHAFLPPVPFYIR
jgi:hypothetical protein